MADVGNSLTKAFDSGDEAFCAAAAGPLAALPGVRAVALGGSRAWGTAGQDSDWDFAVYYRGAGFDPASSVSAAASATKRSSPYGPLSTSPHW